MCNCIHYVLPEKQQKRSENLVSTVMSEYQQCPIAGKNSYKIAKKSPQQHFEGNLTMSVVITS
jgi:hypothetical protein